MTRDEVREKGANVPGKIKEGSVVVFNNADKHDKEPCYYPECGTKGIVVSVHDEGEEPIFVKWEKGSTSEDDYWYCGEDDVTLSKSSYTDPSKEAKADEGKLMLSLVPSQIIRDIAEVRMYGNKKYGDPDNWKTVELKRYIDAAYRHWLAFIDNQTGKDEESGIEHYKHLACNIAFICAIMARQI